MLRLDQAILSIIVWQVCTIRIQSKYKKMNNLWLTNSERLTQQYDTVKYAKHITYLKP